jgi:hypothetical protein
MVVNKQEQKMRTIPTILTRGLTTIVIRPRRVAIYHAGNMGDTVTKSVLPNVDAMLGEGKFDTLMMLGNAEGSADYSWKLTLSRKDFDAVMTE